MKFQLILHRYKILNKRGVWHEQNELDLSIWKMCQN